MTKHVTNTTSRIAGTRHFTLNGVPHDVTIFLQKCELVPGLKSVKTFLRQEEFTVQADTVKKDRSGCPVLDAEGNPVIITAGMPYIVRTSWGNFRSAYEGRYVESEVK